MPDPKPLEPPTEPHPHAPLRAYRIRAITRAAAGPLRVAISGEAPRVALVGPTGQVAALLSGQAAVRSLRAAAECLPEILIYADSPMDPTTLAATCTALRALADELSTAYPLL